MNISYLFSGAVTLLTDNGGITPLLDLCLRHSIQYSDLTPNENGFSVTLRLSEYKRLKRIAEREGLGLTVTSHTGLPAILYRYRWRFGIPVGMLIAAALVILSGLFVWDINVTGNETMTAGEVRELLRAEGFFVGSYIPAANTDRIENKVMLRTDRISWMSINIMGTVAEVQIRERVPPDEKPVTLHPANIVAGKSGVVEEVRIFRGKTAVAAGTNVNEGDLLVSGIIDSQRLGFRYTRASGSVFARTLTEFVIEIPYEYEKISYTGEEYCDKYLNFFDFSMNILKNSGNEGVFYDKIYIVENFCFPDGKETPFAIETVRYLAYEKVKATRSRYEAEALAYFELSRRLADEAEDTVVLRKTVTPIALEDRFLLVCSLVMIEDIAVVKEFEVETVG